MNGKKRSQFQIWVDAFGGIKAVSEQTGVGEHGVRRWLRREGSPSTTNIQRLIELSKGELSFEVIVRDTTLA